MARLICIFAALCVAVSAAPPAPPQFYQQHSAQLQHINPVDYYLDNPEHNYYSQQQQKQGNEAANSNQAARLETLEPDSEVELIPGAQTPHQPPQQTPVAPNIPGLLPGQRVFIVHMPVPGYRPGTIGGYQPVYIVAAAPQGNPTYPGNGIHHPGYQNSVFLSPSNQVVPQLGYPRVQDNGLVLGAPHYYNRHFGLLYQDPGVIYQQAGPATLQAQPEAPGSVRLAQLVKLQAQSAAPTHSGRPQAAEASSAEPKQLSQAITESKDASEDPRRNLRPTSAHAQARSKA